MKKIILFFLFFFPIQVFALTYPELHYEKAIIYDKTEDKIVYTLHSEEEASIASLTKIMTTLTAIEDIDNLEQMVTYSATMNALVSSEASIAGLKIGDKITYKDLLYASILPSGADATTALAISTSGSISSFVAKMNALAEKIGMQHTHFVNVTGLDANGHYSTCDDLLLLLKYALENETFKEIYTTKTYTLSNGLFVKSTLFSYKGDTSMIKGSKTGFTLQAGRCISSYFIVNNHEYIAITLGSPTNLSTVHITDAISLINFIDANYAEEVLVEKDRIVKILPVQFSKVEEYEIKVPTAINKYLEKDYDKEKIKIVYEGLEELSYKTEINAKIGKIKYYYDSELLKEDTIYLEKELKIDIRKIIYAHRKYIYVVGSIFLILLSILVVKKESNNK